MTYEQYWYGEPCMVKAFLKAHKLKTEYWNQQAWLQGAYIYDAVARLAPILQAFAKKGTKPKPYLKAPYKSDTEDSGGTNEATEEQQALRAEVYMRNMIRTGKNWGKP